MSSVINYLIFLIIIKESYSQLQKNLVHIQAKDPDMHRKGLKKWIYIKINKIK